MPTSGERLVRAVQPTSTFFRVAECLKLAQSGHHDRAKPCLLLGVKRTLLEPPISIEEAGYLPPDLMVALANHPRGLEREGRLFRFHICGRLRTWLWSAIDRAGVSFPRRQRGFHLFRHTWATWMRRYGGLDTSGLLETGAWRDRSSAARYEHLDATEEAQKAKLVPVMKRRESGGK